MRDKGRDEEQATASAGLEQATASDGLEQAMQVLVFWNRQRQEILSALKQAREEMEWIRTS